MHHTDELPRPLDSRFGKQSPENDDEFGNGIDIGTVAAGTPNANGERCVEKVMMIEETVYDDSIECHHR